MRGESVFPTCANTRGMLLHNARDRGPVQLPFITNLSGVRSDTLTNEVPLHDDRQECDQGKPWTGHARTGQARPRTWRRARRDLGRVG